MQLMEAVVERENMLPGAYQQVMSATKARPESIR